MITYFHIFISLFFFIKYVLSDTTWNYTKGLLHILTHTINIIGGADWKTNFPLCDDAYMPNLAPIILNKTKLTQFDKTAYFYPNLEKNLVAQLNLEDYGNNIVLNPSTGSFGKVYYNLFEKTFYYFDCQKIYFRVPGEHSFPTDTDKNIIYDMEIQFRCHVTYFYFIIYPQGFIPGEQNELTVFVSVPVKKTEKIADFFKYVNGTVVNNNITIPNFDDLINPVSVFNKVYFYVGMILNLNLWIGGQNFPECDFGVHWILIENVVEVDTFTVATMKNLLNKDINPNGNAKILYTMKDTDALYYRGPQA